MPNRADALLACALTYREAPPSETAVPDTFASADDATAAWMRALLHEAREAMQAPLAERPERPYLHPVDVDTEEPGIVDSKDDQVRRHEAVRVPRVAYALAPGARRQERARRRRRRRPELAPAPSPTCRASTPAQAQKELEGVEQGAVVGGGRAPERARRARRRSRARRRARRAPRRGQGKREASARRARGARSGPRHLLGRPRHHLHLLAADPADSRRRHPPHQTAQRGCRKRRRAARRRRLGAQPLRAGAQAAARQDQPHRRTTATCRRCAPSRPRRRCCRRCSAASRATTSRSSRARPARARPPRGRLADVPEAARTVRAHQRRRRQPVRALRRGGARRRVRARARARARAALGGVQRRPTRRLVCATVSARAGPARRAALDAVFVDEAAQCMEAWTWTLLRPR